MSNTVYRKTERGIQAFKDRSSFLTPQLRSLLIMIDGVKPAHELLKFSGVMGDVTANLERLTVDGLIEAVGGVAMPVVASAAVPIATVAATAMQPSAGALPASPTLQAMPLPLPLLVRQATRILLDGMGPMADPICERLEKCKNTAEAKSLLTRGLEMLREARRTEAEGKLRDLMNLLG